MEAATENKELRILMLEDTPTDAELAEHELRKADIAFTARRVDTRATFVAALEEFHPDIILSDYKLPTFDGMSALQLVRRDHPDIPVIMVTGALPDFRAIELVAAGARDYVLKDRLARLGSAIQRVMAEEAELRARKTAEKALRESEASLRALVEHSPVALLVDEGVEADEKIIMMNRAFTELFGYTLADMPDVRHWWPLAYPDEQYRETIRKLWLERVEHAIASNSTTEPMEAMICCKDSSMRYVRIALSSIGARNIITFEDLTERKRIEAELLRLNRTLRALSAGNHALVHGEDEQTLLNNMCRAVTEGGGYVLAWVGYAMQDDRKSIVPMAISGTGAGYVEALNITWSDEPLGRGPTGSAVRSGQTQIADNIQNDPRMEPWRSAAAHYGYASSIALPLMENAKTIGALTIYSAEPDAFGTDQVALLKEMAGDLAFGIMSLRTRNERDRALEERQHFADQLRASLEDALQAISATVEMRDPYTAGHQRRVADLASAIARELKLPDEQVHGIRLASIVHDLGKIHIPAEILSKPGRLSEIEFSFIKTHPQAGHEILKEIQFPWPIAQAVLQHHERLDGTGYPQGLKSEAIILEARILTVADVIEAMASHRPYRPTLGQEVALDEIRKHRGILYDADVVDACIRLFLEKGYQLPAP